MTFSHKKSVGFLLTLYHAKNERKISNFLKHDFLNYHASHCDTDQRTNKLFMNLSPNSSRLQYVRMDEHSGTGTFLIKMVLKSFLYNWYNTGHRNWKKKSIIHAISPFQLVLSCVQNEESMYDGPTEKVL